METRAHYVLVGFFAVALAGATALFAIWAAGSAFDREFAQYDVVFQGPVRGLAPAGQVRFNGITVGEVTQLGLDPDDSTKVIARIRVASETPFRVDSVAQLEPQGLTGLAYVQVSAGTPDAALLTDMGGRIPRIPSRQAQLEAFLEGGEDIVANASETLIRLNSLFSDDNITAFTNTLENIEAVSAAAAEQRAFMAQATAVLIKFEEAAGRIDQAARDMSTFAVQGEALLQDGVDPMIAEVDAAARDLRRAALDAQSIMDSVEGPVERFANDGLEGMTLAVGDARRVMLAVERLADALEDDPAALVAGARYDEVEVPR